MSPKWIFVGAALLPLGGCVVAPPPGSYAQQPTYAPQYSYASPQYTYATPVYTRSYNAYVSPYNYDSAGAARGFGTPSQGGGDGR